MTPATKEIITSPSAGIDRTNAVITLRNVRKAFGDLQVLKGIDLDVFKGENVVVPRSQRQR